MLNHAVHKLPDNSHLTAIVRTAISRPTAWLLEKELLNGSRILDYGCGHGYDAKECGFKAYDPAYAPNLPRGKFNQIVSNFVLDVISPEEQTKVLRRIKSLLTHNGEAYIAVRRDLDPSDRPIKKAHDTLQYYVELPLPLIRQQKDYDIYLLTKYPFPERHAEHGVGKMVGNSLYVHRSAEDVLPQGLLKEAKKKLPHRWKYDVVKYNAEKKQLTFFACPDFDKAHEPAQGDGYIVSSRGSARALKAPADPLIYHHKWTMVRPGYNGFKEGPEVLRSLTWMKIAERMKGHEPSVHTKINKQSYWEENFKLLLARR